jgi:hypothetical protein
MELSEPEGESPLLTHVAWVFAGPANSLFLETTFSNLMLHG